MTTTRAGKVDSPRTPRVSLETLRGAPLRAGGGRVTPIARRLTLRWSGGGGWVYAWPAMVEVESAGGTLRRRIFPLQLVALAALAAIALAALAGGVAQWISNKAAK
ncbi:MAG TPA: hypothetical protein VF808_04125 [Ktedonobacterales bacterium]